MSEVTPTTLDHASDVDLQRGAAVFSAGPEDGLVQRWGPVFSVFGEDLDQVLAGAADVAAETESLIEEVHAAARRYSALLEVICNGTVGAGRPCTVYECCDGVSVLLLSQRPASQQVVEDVLSVFEDEKTALNESVFIALLSKGIQTFFEKNVADPSGIVTVSVGAGDYCFMRAEQRDAILQKLQIATSADAY